MEAIKILRLKSGEDIITYLEQVDKLNFIVREPMVVLLKNDTRSGRQIIMMDHWLPAPLIQNNEAFITESEIVTILEPTSEFSEYFENAVDTIHKAKTVEEDSSEASEEEMSKDLMTMMLDSVGPDISIVH
jgi:hypothetical protein